MKFFYFKPTKKLFIYKIHKFTVNLLHMVPVVYSKKNPSCVRSNFSAYPLTGSFLLLMMSVQGDDRLYKVPAVNIAVNFILCLKIFLIAKMLNNYILPRL